jgi:hypothetical protein
MPDETPAAPTTSAPSTEASPWTDSGESEDSAAPHRETASGAPSEFSRSADPEWDEAKRSAGFTGKDKEKPKDGKAPPKKPGEPESKEEREERTRRITVKEWNDYHSKRKSLNEREAQVAQRDETGRKSLAAVEARTKELEARAAHLDAIETNPKAFVEHFAKRTGTSPSKIVNALNEFFLEGRPPVELEIDKLRAEQKKRDEAEEERRKEAAAAGEKAKVDQYLSQIAAHVTANDEKFAMLGAYPANVVANEAWRRIVHHYNETGGQTLPLDKVLLQLEAEEEAEFLKKEERRQKRRPGGAQQVSETPARGGSAGQASPDEAQRPTTLNHKLAGQRSPVAREESDHDAWANAKRSAGISR